LSRQKIISDTAELCTEDEEIIAVTTDIVPVAVSVFLMLVGKPASSSLVA
jgi:hypothetical protein